MTEVLKSHDRTLFAHQTNTGMVQVWRKAERWSAALAFDQETPPPSVTCPQFILALTDNLKLTGKPVEWGLDPLIRLIQGMDSWQQGDMLGQMTKKREAEKEDQDRSKRNELKARAYDMRRDFARAFNDVNTSTLKKTEQKTY